jgi:hypothetical protein
MRAYFTWMFTAELFMVACRNVGRTVSLKQLDNGWRVDYN